MEQLQQVQLGFNQMRAAVTGGHSLIDAFNEIPTMTRQGACLDVVTGGLGCMLLCIDAIQKVGLLQRIPHPELNEFLHSDHTARLAACKAALGANDFLTLGPLVAVMVLCIEPHCDRLSFAGNEFSVAVVSSATGK
jgi:hypothetical protein